MKMSKLLWVALLLGTGLGVLCMWTMKKKKRHLALDEAVNKLMESCMVANVIVVSSASELYEAVSCLQADLVQLKILGLDCEWVTRGKDRRKISMLQLSTFHTTVLIRLHLSSTTELLSDILSDKRILKVGVSILEDAEKLNKDYGMTLRGCIDLRHIVCRLQPSWRGAGLKMLAEEVAGVNLDKSDLLRRGDWEALELSSAQVGYAAGDSKAGLAVFLQLVKCRLDASEQFCSTEQLLSAIDKSSGPLCQGIKDVPYKQQPIKKSATAITSLQSPKLSTKTISSSALQSGIMYSNCTMQAPDGQVLCLCDSRKAEWYIDKGLAVRMSEPGDELVIRLCFEPRGRPSGEKDYYRTRKENICVVCGATGSFTRKHIVPREYRKHFPELLKSHSSHDVVLLCADCHLKHGYNDNAFKEHFAKLCEAPINNGTVVQDEQVKRVRSAARALTSYAQQLPLEKSNEYKSVLKHYFNIEEVSDDVLQKALTLDDKVPAAVTEVGHGERVVQYMMKRGQLQEFQQLWRKRFLDLMQPKYLGEYWHVDYNHKDYLWINPDSTAPCIPREGIQTHV